MIPEEDKTTKDIEAIIQQYLAQNLSLKQTAGVLTLQSGSVQSQLFNVGSIGWKISDNGDVEFNNGKFRGDITGASGIFSGTLSAILGSIGGWTISALAIYKDGATDALSSGLAPADLPFYAGKKYTDRATAPFRVTPAGALVASSATITGALTAAAGSVIATSYLSGEVGQTNLNVASRGWVQTCVFSVTDADTIAWGAGALTSADGTAYTISAGNTGNMSAKTYIYLDTAVSSTVYQTTTTAATAVGAGKVLVAIAQNGTGEATYKVLQGQGGENIDASSIVAGSISANELSASLVYAGAITIDTAGLIKSGQTAYDTGTGWWIGNVTGTPKLSIGNASGNKMTWDGTTLKVVGDINAGSAYVATAGETLVAGDAVFVADGTQGIIRINIDGNSAATGNYPSFGMITDYIRSAQKFVATNTETITQIRVWLRILNAPTDIITCGIQGDSGGYPDGTYISSADLDYSAMTSSYVEYTFAISAALTQGTTYHVVLRRKDEAYLHNTNYYQVRTSTDNPYASGGIERYTGVSPAWEVNAANNDMDFKIVGVVATTGNVLKTVASLTGYYETFVGFAKTAIASGATGSIEVGGFTSSLSGLTIGKLYYLSDTPGAISTSVGTNTRKVGISISTTSLILTNLW